MFSKRETRVMVFIATFVTLGGGLLLYTAPASTNVNPAPVVRSSVVSDATLVPWPAPSAQAVGSGGIENDLDGNASALVASDQ